MKITRENYESFFLDYLEDNLKEEFIDSFLDFLEQNPDLKEELHLFDHLNLPEEEIVFSGKSQLYKSVANEKAALENKFIAYLEGDLEDQERHSFTNYLKVQPELQKEYNLFAKTRLVADTAIIFPEKHQLKRKSRPAIILNWIVSAAAVMLLLWGISSVITNRNQPENPSKVPEIAEVISKPILQPEKAVDAKTISETAKEPKSIATKEPKPLTQQIVEPLAEESPAENQSTDLRTRETGEEVIAEISPKMARLDPSEKASQLEFSPTVKASKSGESAKVLTIEEFLTVKAKKVSDEGLLSVQRIARAGLGVASELSGERIGYVEKNGKIESIEFESKLFAFSIPLKKK